ncbi:MAG: pilus assembly protein PilM [Pirellulales bacterium]|nr:pilus assembly protein PilM [Pirellulales bacterium]
MAKVASRWGIDIGQCALKALRCTVSEDAPDKIVAEAFDYIEYPKILSQPEAEPEEIVREALQSFLSRNDLQGTQISVSVSGQSGLARFIKLPPVEVKKIPDIVRYEANQQIPFDLDEVIWDYQRMWGGSEEEGFALDAEVGLFAMKRDQVYEEIAPYQEAGIDIDIVQLTPLAIYNFISFDQIDPSLWSEEYDPENPPESIIVLSVGTETTDLVITNGYRVWQRPIPLGGSHFTKALIKELQLTYAKAEHLKRNATKAEDPKAIYQAMRPIFKDLLTEIERSMGYFQSLDKGAKISRVVALGNSLKLPGLERYLNKNLGLEVEHLTELRTLAPSVVTQSPAFKDHLSAFAISYGLALQGLSKAAIGTNLVPQEIVWERTIDRKKPWAVAATALLGIACLINFIILWWSWSQVQISSDNQWAEATRQADLVIKKANNLSNKYNEALGQYNQQKERVEAKLAIFNNKKNYLDLCQAVYQCMPDDRNRTQVKAKLSPKQRRKRGEKEEATEPEGFENQASDETSGDVIETSAAKVESQPQGPTNKMDIWITDLKVRKVPNLASWYTAANKVRFAENAEPLRLKMQASGPETVQGQASWKAEEGDPNVEEYPAPEKKNHPSGPPRGPGYVVQLKGYHFHDSPLNGSGKKFVQRTFVHNLQERNISLPDQTGSVSEIPISALGISHPLVFEADEKMVTSPFGQDANKQLTQYRFTVQFAWQPQKKDQLP